VSRTGKSTIRSVQVAFLDHSFFVIFINDLPDNVSPSTNSALYADDASRMKFNTGKCKVLTVAGKPKPIEFPYRMYGNELSSCKAEKDLGLLVSSNLKWDPHILKIVAKANKMLGLLKRTCFEITNTQVRRTLYLTLVKTPAAHVRM
jgi:hypothetical protein